jgi:hypothetical protein
MDIREAWRRAKAAGRRLQGAAVRAGLALLYAFGLGSARAWAGFFHRRLLAADGPGWSTPPDGDPAAADLRGQS